MNPLHAEKVLFTVDDEFRFSCHRGLGCYNTCCHDVNIFLTPYDVLRMRRSIGLSPRDFLDRYTARFMSEEGLPLVLLKVSDDPGKSCPFVTPDGCGIYQDRPWSCRMYPVFPVSSEEVEYLIEDKGNCLGFKEDHPLTVREWKKNQEIDVYDRMNEPYKQITRHAYFQSGNKLDPAKSKMLFRACYELDEFGKMLFHSKFFEIYDIEQDVMEKIKEDEEELLQFGYRWIRFSLFSEDTLRLRDKEMDKLLQARSKISS